MFQPSAHSLAGRPAKLSPEPRRPQPTRTRRVTIPNSVVIVAGTRKV